MAGVFRSSGRRTNPLGAISVVTGLVSALASAILWIYRIQPDSKILGQYSAELADQLVALAAILGVMAVLSSIMTSSSGEGGGSYFMGLVFGLVGLSYPLLDWLNVMSEPLRPSIL